MVFVYSRVWKTCGACNCCGMEVCHGPGCIKRQLCYLPYGC
jgi:hypothetical protein